MMRIGRYVPLLVFSVITLVGILLMAPISQDISYHQFAGQSTKAGVPNFWNVVSNIPFLFVGLMGLIFCVRSCDLQARLSWGVFFLGVTFVAFGSSWYHLHPANMSLVWDRLPMAVGFMGLFVALLSEYLDERAQKLLLLPCLALGAGAVLVWDLYDDLRLYVWVQFFPLLTIVILLFFYRSRYSQKNYIAGALSLYGLAKLFELGDHQIYDFTGQVIAGHPIKHLLAAGGVALLYRMIKQRMLT
ncbi:MAG: ceramidase [bacterium]|nr:ceramidase [bacterium]